MTKYVKYSLLFFNLILASGGISVIITNNLFLDGESKFTEFIDGFNTQYAAGFVLYIAGFFLIVTSFIGFYGAVRENYCVVVTFGVILFVIFLIGLAGGIAMLIIRAEWQRSLKGDMHCIITQMKEFPSMNCSTAHSKGDAGDYWDNLQLRFNCCGVYGPNDYTYNGVNIPASCCAASEASCDAKKAYQNGCYPLKLSEWMKRTGIIGGVLVAVTPVYLLGCVLAFYMAREIAGEA